MSGRLPGCFYRVDNRFCRFPHIGPALAGNHHDFAAALRLHQVDLERAKSGELVRRLAGLGFRQDLRMSSGRRDVPGLEEFMTLMPNGQAAACKAVTCGFDSRRRLFSGLLGWRFPSRGARGTFFGFESVRSERGSERISSKTVTEHQTDNLAVAGSIPVPSSHFRCPRRENDLTVGLVAAWDSCRSAANAA